MNEMNDTEHFFCISVVLLYTIHYFKSLKCCLIAFVISGYRFIQVR